MSSKKPKTISYRGYLEVRELDGTTAFAAIERILQSPDLQKRCSEQRELRKIITQLRRAGLLREKLNVPQHHAGAMMKQPPVPPDWLTLARNADYLSKLPKRVPAGRVLIHNHVKPTRRLGSRGFRAWLAAEDTPGIEACDCGWCPEFERHFRASR
jgi:hypothetical protein